VGDDGVREWEQRRLRQELLAPHVVGQLELGVLRSFGDHDSMPGAREHVHQAPHEVDVGRAEAAE
jgi:hypothetical protein